MLNIVQRELVQTFLDLAPIVVILAFFGGCFLRRHAALWRRALIGMAHLVLGLTLFRIGLDTTLLPLAADLAQALAEKVVAQASAPHIIALVAFAVALGATAAMIEPTMAATADRVRDLTGGTVRPLVLRLAVAAGFGMGLGLAGLRLVVGLQLGLVLMPMVVVMCILAVLAPRRLVPLALDSGAIATSAVTVPMMTAYGVAVADALPGRSALADGFGFLILAMIGSAISVLAVAIVEDRPIRIRKRKLASSGEGP